MIERYCKEEVTDLKAGYDFRRPEYRREVFLRLYEFHLKYRLHPGIVYLMFPYLSKAYSLDKEEKYWLAFINGCTQNICTSWVIFNFFPDFKSITEDSLERWHRQYWKKLDYDIDKRYSKGHFVENFVNYKNNLKGLTQEQFFEEGLCFKENPFDNFKPLWDYVMKNFHLFGRLSTFSYLEYLKIIGLNIDCDDLFMEDLSGSKSHRNGILKVCGRDDLDWHKENPSIKKHSKEIVDFATVEAEALLSDAKKRFHGSSFYNDVNYFTLESTLCCYKSHYRKNRRYPNVYNDMFYFRIKKAETHGWEKYGVNFNDFWKAREENIPKHLLLEFNLGDPCHKRGNLDPIKQNHFRETGQMIMMDEEWPEFSNDFNLNYYER